MIEMGRVEKPLAGAFFSLRNGILLCREEVQRREPFEDPFLLRRYKTAGKSDSSDPINAASAYLVLRIAGCRRGEQSSRHAHQQDASEPYPP